MESWSEQLEAVAHDYFNPRFDPFEVASRHNLAVTQVMDMIELPEFKAFVARLRRVIDERDALLQRFSTSRAIRRTNEVIDALTINLQSTNTAEVRRCAIELRRIAQGQQPAESQVDARRTEATPARGGGAGALVRKLYAKATGKHPEAPHPKSQATANSPPPSPTGEVARGEVRVTEGGEFKSSPNLEPHTKPNPAASGESWERLVEELDHVLDANNPSSHFDPQNATQSRDAGSPPPSPSGGAGEVASRAVGMTEGGDPSSAPDIENLQDLITELERIESHADSAPIPSPDPAGGATPEWVAEEANQAREADNPALPTPATEQPDFNDHSVDPSDTECLLPVAALPTTINERDGPA